MEEVHEGMRYRPYKSELDLPDIVGQITSELSEPYSVYTYRYFIHNWPELCYLAYDADTGRCAGVIVGKLDQHRMGHLRGYIAMLAVEPAFRRRRIGSHLVRLALASLQQQGCTEVVLETEVTNGAALNLYERLGFIRDKRLIRYYLNGVDAFRLKLWLA
ncbi:hypothetical protein BOX15_Mlig015449g4 [Macrostomum lignano]|uniref:N-acetyltransferase domain-containing protein n=2 Tax=Macrostomum lignano TaxID=282301 RepID=A0A1I8HGB1_9PLAT|nr:hypothetical protein BOX15_Mlig015449g4 [Macrostomum lignano]